SSRAQAIAWSAGYAALALLSIAIAWHAVKHRQDDGRQPDVWEPGATDPSLNERIAWVGLAACGSALLLAVTNELSQNVAPVPLLWTLPLAVYLTSYVICFAGRLYSRAIWVPAMWVGLAAMAVDTYA